MCLMMVAEGRANECGSAVSQRAECERTGGRLVCDSLESNAYCPVPNTITMAWLGLGNGNGQKSRLIFHL